MTDVPIEYTPPRMKQLRMLALSFEIAGGIAPGGSASTVVPIPFDYFRPERLVVILACGPIIDLGRFYAIRSYRGKSRRRGRRSSWLAANSAMRVSRNLTIPGWVQVTNVTVGNESQFASDDGIPADVFAPNVNGLGALNMDPATKDHAIRISFANPDGRFAHVRGAFMGNGPA